MRALVLEGLDRIGRHAPAVLAASVFVGLLVPPLAALLRPWLVPFFMVPMAISLMRVDWRLMAAHAARPGPILLLVGWTLLLMPVLVWAVLSPLGLPPALLTAIVLMSAAPPISAAAAFGLILGLDAPLMVVTVVSATLATPFTLPPMALSLLDLRIDISALELMLRLAGLIAAMLAAAWIGRRLLGPPRIARNARRLDGVSVLSLAGFAAGIMAGVTEVLLTRTGFFFLTLGLAFAANLGLQALGGGLFAWMGRRPALSVALMSGNCNMGIVIAVLADRAEADVLVFFALAQIPMYTLPALLLTTYRRLLGGERLPGPPDPLD